MIILLPVCLAAVAMAAVLPEFNRLTSFRTGRTSAFSLTAPRKLGVLAVRFFRAQQQRKQSETLNNMASVLQVRERARAALAVLLQGSQKRLLSISTT